MSAISGIFYRNGHTVNPELIKKMNNKLSHRGPDGSAIWHDKQVALGHQMLYTTPESLYEKLPFHDEKAGLIITADARIDNRKELSEDLDIENIGEVSDSYFILKSYEKWGEKCPEHLLGDFAFAIWDEKEEKLFCARDHMGIKPFYYYLDDTLFVFGTEIKALFDIPGVPYKLNELKVAFYLMDIEDNKFTFYEDIYTFSSAHALTIDQNRMKLRKYWEINPESSVTMESDEDYANTFREIFTDAVKCRLRSAFPIGYELSGGLDSSSIVSVAKKILKNNNSSINIKTFSITFNKFSECDESEYIQSIINTGNIDAHFICGDNLKPFDQIDTILYYQEQPFFSQNIVNLWKLYKKMYENNVRIVLSGNGGDAVISYGTNYFRDLAVTLKWKTLIKEINCYSKYVNKGIINIFLINILYNLLPQNIKAIIRTYNKRRPSIDILNKSFVNRVEANKYLNEIYWEQFNKANTAKKYHHLSLSTDNFYFLEMLNRTTSVFSLETRYPFLDKRLVEFCYAIPTEIKFKNGYYRYIQRIAMEGILPKMNQWRHKGPSFSSLFHETLLIHENDRLNDIIFPNNKIIKKYVDLKRIKEIYQETLNEKNQNSASTDLWYVSLLYLWLKEFNIS